MSILVWTMTGMAVWHFAVLVPDKFTGGIIGAFLAGVAGAFVTGYLLPSPGIPSANPPGYMEAVWAVPGSVLALFLLYRHGSWQESRTQTNEGRSDVDPLRRRGPFPPRRS